MHFNKEKACNMCGNSITHTHTHTHTSLYWIIIAGLLGGLISSETLALGGLGIGHKSKSRNPNGLQAINAYICTNLNCPKSDIKLVEDCGFNAELDHGICKCVDGFIGNGQNCESESCPSGTKPNDDNSKCISVCPVGTINGEGEQTELAEDGITQCYCENLGEIYDGSECRPNTGDPLYCKSYRSCPKDADGHPQFCDMTSYVSGCTEAPTNGICRPAIVKNVSDKYKTLDRNQSTTSWSGVMDWWTAIDFCDAIGAQPVGAFDNCTDTEKEKIISNTGEYNICLGWQQTDEIPKPTIKNIAKGGGGGGGAAAGLSYWTKDLMMDYNPKVASDSCSAYTLVLPVGKVSGPFPRDSFWGHVPGPTGGGGGLGVVYPLCE